MTREKRSAVGALEGEQSLSALASDQIKVWARLSFMADFQEGFWFSAALSLCGKCS